MVQAAMTNMDVLLKVPATYEDDDVTELTDYECPAGFPWNRLLKTR